MIFDEAAENIISILNNIYRSAHISVLLYQDEEHHRIKCNNVRCKDDAKAAEKDCEQLINEALEYIVRMQTGQESIICWENMTELSMSALYLRRHHGLYNGISVIIKPKHDITWCISIFSDESQRRDDFHKKFCLKRDKIMKILNTYDECELIGS